ncbi:hypothetical protein A2U01_0075865 [Trifolium medium]|uniref:Uncharacterized protein n=1 Tax=Trifolium medium TaxID=97028 RepID=A0A392T2T8_9FABA|nr:hypothetical protein [Trifolium medium]
MPPPAHPPEAQAAHVVESPIAVSVLALKTQWLIHLNFL